MTSSVSSLASPVRERHRHPGETPQSATKMLKGTGASLSGGKGGRAGTAQPGAEKAQGDLINGYKYLMGGMKMREPGSFQWCLVTGPAAMGTH